MKFLIKRITIKYSASIFKKVINVYVYDISVHMVALFVYFDVGSLQFFHHNRFFFYTTLVILGRQRHYIILSPDRTYDLAPNSYKETI